MRGKVKPRIGIVCDLRPGKEDPDDPRFICRTDYVKAVADGSGAHPILIPPRETGEQDINELLAYLDAVVLVGSPSPWPADVCQNQELSILPPGAAVKQRFDQRLLKAVYERDLPCLGICHGMMAMNIARGGLVRVIPQDADVDHCGDKNRPIADQMQQAHTIVLEKDGILAWLARGQKEMMVNSMHPYVLSSLGDGLVSEACALDGTIEAFRAIGKRLFAGVLFHPDAAYLSGGNRQGADIDFYKKIMALVGASARGRVDLRQTQWLRRVSFEGLTLEP